MNILIEPGDIVKIKKGCPISDIDDVSGKIIKFDYGIVLTIISEYQVCIAPYSSQGKIPLRTYADINLPNRIDVPINKVQLILKGNEADGKIRLK